MNNGSQQLVVSKSRQGTCQSYVWFMRQFPLLSVLHFNCFAHTRLAHGGKNKAPRHFKQTKHTTSQGRLPTDVMFRAVIR